MRAPLPVTSGEATFHMLEIKAGRLLEHGEEKLRTLVLGIMPKAEIALPASYTHFGIVVSGEIVLTYGRCRRHLVAGDFFSVVGSASINSLDGFGFVSSAFNYVGFNLFGGPIEEKGRLRYIDGCTDTLLVPPVRKGDPCLNHLHFPCNIVQTPHTHPSVRAGIVLRGRGECVLPGEGVPLVPGYAFVIEPEAVHSFNTTDETMDIVAFHPDSDTGLTDDDHPALNSMMVDGISARDLSVIRTL